MNRQHLDQMWDHLRQVNGIALRCIALVPADQIDSHPIPNMRTPKELAVHMYGMIFRNCTESVVKGTVEDQDEKAVTSTLRTKDDLLKFCRTSWEAADKAARSVTDAQLQSVVKTPWGVDFPAHVMFGIVHDEFIHHRGQLYAYLRALGVEPPMIWDFEHNEAPFQPKTQTTTA